MALVAGIPLVDLSELVSGIGDDPRLISAPTREDGPGDPRELIGPRDILVLKQMPSAFHGTRLQSYLTFLRCDSVIVTGTTTSGCVRASVIDAFSRNFSVIVAEECCFDRSQASHAINLCDMNAKYADVISTAEVIKYIDALPTGLFELPSGVPVAQR